MIYNYFVVLAKTRYYIILKEACGDPPEARKKKRVFKDRLVLFQLFCYIIFMIFMLLIIHLFYL